MKKIALLIPLLAATFSAIAQNPYLPLWEHLPDGEPRVFEDPDAPGKYRIYIIGSHDIAYRHYCGPDIHMWSAPVEDLDNWVDEGPVFKYCVDGEWDVMFAPDLVEVKDRDGHKTYWLYPHSRGYKRVATVCRGERPDGPFYPVNMTRDGRECLSGSLIDFDPSVYIEYVTDKTDPDYDKGFRAYAYYGFQRSVAIELDQNTMYSLRPGTEVHDFFIPSSARYGVILDPEGTEYPFLYKDQNPGEFNFYEASSIRKIGNKYVMIFSGFSGPDYGLESTNSALRYAFGDSPLGPWRSGGVLVDSRGVVPDEKAEHLTTKNFGHNTHGSIQEINGQWYVFYHRPARGFGHARQAMVAPIKIEWDKKSVAEGGQVRITGYDPYAKNCEWTASASDGTCYSGAEVTSEGFHIFGLDPYRYYSAGIACYLSGNDWMQDSWDNWDNNMLVAGVTDGGIVGFKYFGFGGLKSDSKGIKAFAGAKKGNRTALNVFLTPTGGEAFKIHVMLDGPYANDVWKGKEIAVLEVGADAPAVESKLVADVAGWVEGLKGKHAIYLVAEGPDHSGKALFDLHGIGFSSKDKEIERAVPPKVHISVDGTALEIPATPVRYTHTNGISDVRTYKVRGFLTDSSRIEVSADSPEVKINVSDIVSGRATVTCTYRGMEKIFDVGSRNPIFKDNYTADPAPVVLSDGRLYVYCGHDEFFEDRPGYEGKYGFNITDWLCYSTDDMINWKSHGVVLAPKDFGWSHSEAWASQVVEKDGKYYYYVSLQGDAPYNAKCIGVAVSDSPTGPFADAIGKPLVTDEMTDNGPRGWWNDIDPTVFIDDDGTPWMSWGNGTCFLVRLKNNMTELDGEIQVLPMVNYVEGPWLYKRNGKYYLVYASMGDGLETISYAMADNIQGPWEFKGELTEEATDSFTIHPGIIDYKGHSYLFYHNSTLSLDGYGPATGRRSVCVNEMFYNEDGTIRRVEQY